MVNSQDAHRQPGSLAFPAETNAVLHQGEPGKVEIRFPRDGYMQPGRHEFRDEDDLLSYLAQAFPSKRSRGQPQGSINRIGKYRRVDTDGRPIFTFGDPVLDLITNEHGEVLLGGRRVDMRRAELAEPGLRGGGNKGIDLADLGPDMINAQLVDAALGQGKFTLVEYNRRRVVLASNNPHVIWHYDPDNASVKMRFRAFSKSYVLYWKAGADIETWGRDFTSASITSRYGYFLGGLCFAACQDSDSDTNDDYVDEYEWGVNSPQPDGVRSVCTAVWGGEVYSGVVETGCIVVDLGDTGPC